MEQEVSYEQIQEAANYILSKVEGKPVIGIICGACLSALGDAINPKMDIPFEEIPNFPCSCKTGHPSKIIVGNISGVPVICVQGRCHFYEGVSLAKCVMPVRVMKLIGVNQIILLNDAGGLNQAYNAGDIMIIKDHINFMGLCGNNPLCGENDERWGPRMPPMIKVYDRALIDKAKEKFKESKLDGQIFEGVYACVSGPNYETIAEAKMLKVCGIDAVGMSITPEAIVAKHCGMTILALSLISNISPENNGDIEFHHDDIAAVSHYRTDVMSTLVQKIVGDVGQGAKTCACGK